MPKILLITALLHCMFRPSQLQLLINVKNQGGDVMQENITANVSEDTVTLEFLRLDGVLVTQLVDFANEVEAMRLVVPAEEELSSSGAPGPPQVLCFLSHAGNADFIAPDAMAKLRQKNPGTVRVAEEERGWRQVTATAWAGAAAGRLSSAAGRLCAPAAAMGNVFIRHSDLDRWPPRPGVESGSEGEAVSPFPSRAAGGDAVTGCAAARRGDDCLCDAEVCVNWYPCGLKYCKGKPAGGLSYRCGIKTCRRCYRYRYYARRKDHCVT